MNKGLLIVFPGTGYTTKELLFQNCIELYKNRMYFVIELDYSQIPFKDIETVEEAVERANQQTMLQINDVNFREYDDIVFISKSLGTVCAGWLERCLNIHPRQLYLTPIKGTLPYVSPESHVIGMALGSLDELMSVDKLSEFCESLGINYLIINGVGHNLKMEGLPDKNREINLKIMNLCS